MLNPTQCECYSYGLTYLLILFLETIDDPLWISTTLFVLLNICIAPIPCFKHVSSLYSIHDFHAHFVHKFFRSLSRWPNKPWRYSCHFFLNLYINHFGSFLILFCGGLDPAQGYLSGLSLLARSGHTEILRTIKRPTYMPTYYFTVVFYNSFSSTTISGVRVPGSCRTQFHTILDKLNNLQ